jgi:hypothetical protein
MRLSLHLSLLLSSQFDTNLRQLRSLCANASPTLMAEASRGVDVCKSRQAITRSSALFLKQDIRTYYSYPICSRSPGSFLMSTSNHLAKLGVSGSQAGLDKGDGGWKREKSLPAKFTYLPEIPCHLFDDVATATLSHNARFNRSKMVPEESSGNIGAITFSLLICGRRRGFEVRKDLLCPQKHFFSQCFKSLSAKMPSPPSVFLATTFAELLKLSTRSPRTHLQGLSSRAGGSLQSLK